ncbi:molecular chaperone GrpE [Methylobacterium sp. Leaf125]|jgi:molecular chaperone GrpE|uniref:nucleotide exchange factor GrpE n=1 Tax=unclassified Methylobacterium TaxID=2615210 RepID=UPI0006FAE0BD|nr:MULTISPECIES: nucleotide exchange factor GrpE [unclassified Methylobacterium]KQQ47952.1 molecular chaperone GrpE [Methylobacterium sp. Leaf125]POR43888.1 nucleotide exchange factor GrpE [Methylobacterium sp. V23]
MMANDMHDERRDPAQAVEETPGAAQAESAGSGEAMQADALATLVAERDELKDRVLRTLAEMENLRRRTEREVADARAYAVTNFARDLLNSADNIRRALESIPEADRTGADGAFKALIDGIELTERDLAKTLERHGVKLIEPKGQRFDPNRHQAMFEVPDPEVPAGTVVQVMQAGYIIGDRVLRPALVGVAKGGPKPTAANPADAA